MNIQQELERIFAGRSLPADIDPLPDGWPPRARSPRRAFSWQSPKYCMTVKEALDIFCKLINGEKPILVPLEPRPWAKLKKCFDNTDEMVARHGGRKCLGWLFQHRPFGNGPGVFLGVHHAVWEHDGRLLDVTPPCEDTMLNGNAIWFLPDRSATQLRPAGSTIEIPRPNRVYSPSKNPGVQKLVQALRQQEMADHAKRVAFARIASAARRALDGE